MCNLEPKIYVACLSSYNSSLLHGRWIDATLDADEIQDEINAMLAESPCPGAEEWAIHDYEEFGELRIDENTGIKSIVELVKFIEEHEELGEDLSTAVLQYCDQDIDSSTAMLENNYHGEHDSELDFATELFDELYAYEIPEHLRNYIDYEAFRYDIFIDSYYSLEVGYKTHVFSY